MNPLLESIVDKAHYDNLPESWRIPAVDRFSADKQLYSYQIDALKKAAQALFFYYEDGVNWIPKEAETKNISRKFHFTRRYETLDTAKLAVTKYDSPADERNHKPSRVFHILRDYINSDDDERIRYQYLINRMCFWMATGSGKTLVMVKLIEYLHSLIRHGEVPPHHILLLAPSEHLLTQIRRTVEEFNRSGLHIDLVPLREAQRRRQQQLGNSVTVFYHRSDNISDVQKEALTDYRMYENDGKWYIFLDEAHKGGKEDSKRQAYYAVMARNGFLFNFSATFTDEADIITTVKKYNLQEFIRGKHGKNIYLNETEYGAFKQRKEEINDDERRKIVLKSLITLTHVSQRVRALRDGTGIDNLYHTPMMLTLVNSVNTDIENERNDLWAFFQTLRALATGEPDEALFKAAKDELAKDWRDAKFLFDTGALAADEAQIVRKMTIPDLREAVFLSRRKSALQLIRSADNKELAFQMKNADRPFALIRIGNTSKWRNLLNGYEETTTLRDNAYFDGLENSPITILMGSRSFFESWDSNRPNVINFINIGGGNAKKFVVQSVGRGVRIETKPGKRGRLELVRGEDADIEALHRQGISAQPAETLFLFATNRAAVKTVLEGLATEKEPIYEKLAESGEAPLFEIQNKDLPLLIPVYREVSGDGNREPFAMSDATLQRFRNWLDNTSDAVFAVRDALTVSQITALRAATAGNAGVRLMPEKNYAILPFLQERLVSHLSQKAKISDGVREIDEDSDIIHFREIAARPEDAPRLREVIHRVRAGETSNEDIAELARQLGAGEITREEFNRKVTGQKEETFRDLTVKKLARHYYLPVILGDDKVDYIRHIIKVDSEIRFLNALERWLDEKPKEAEAWDAWMFSKIDEAVDDVHIPYYDVTHNRYRRFLPDFIFWMRRKNEYRIIFVDPKGTEHASSYRKIEHYAKLFRQDGKCRIFKHGKWQVSVDLCLYNPTGERLDRYRDFWIRQPGDIFRR